MLESAVWLVVMFLFFMILWDDNVDFLQVICYKNKQFLISHIIHGLNLASPNMLNLQAIRGQTGQ